ncbi:hypothetical protein EVAR_33694_1 [Eumeta japonica]|uniref:Uncharacterized protein n=1 Tax=Eumeta variegata TaxID=151549 RepID=A0A4C1VLX0_EUMVA|nr:hypothetical protein EVAR_33694_1 [Eumeta japonica]
MQLLVYSLHVESNVGMATIDHFSSRLFASASTPDAAAILIFTHRRAGGRRCTENDTHHAVLGGLSLLQVASLLKSQCVAVLLHDSDLQEHFFNVRRHSYSVLPELHEHNRKRL